MESINIEISPGCFLQSSDVFVASLTPEKLTAYGDWIEQGETDLVPIQKRLDALTCALAEDWCPPRVIENEIDHLNIVISGRYVAKYLKEILSTLQDGEADLALWQQMTPAQRDERRNEREREKAEANERREARAQINERQNAFYAAMFAAGISPIPMSEMSRPGFQLSESSRKMHEMELQIANLGNDL
jgi:hypothetical protein